MHTTCSCGICHIIGIQNIPTEIRLPCKWRTFDVESSAFSVTAQDRPSVPQGCSDGGCYPATGNLLIGRADKLSASSTCGLWTEEEYCIVSHLQQEDKCFTCDSRKPYDVITKRSHRIESVIYMMDEEMDLTWWQSSNGMEEVNIQLDLEAEFHFTHLIMKFKVIYKVLDPSIKVKDPYSLEIQELLQITNLRIKFTKLHTLGDNLLDRRVEVLKKYYYAVYELVVRGSCFCYGHASECTPISGMTGGVEGMIHGRCVCKHNTEGLNCERCKPFFNDLPWSPAEARNPHTCKECNCNGHSSQCHFDMAVYLATGNVSGGVCDNCLHNTMGRNCEICKPFYYQDPSRDIRNPAACIACDCDPVGSLDGGICDSHTDLTLGILAGQCRCKENVKGIRCDYCKEGFYGLSRNDPVGCQPCNCDPRGITIGEAPCDQISGDCSRKRYVTGRYCNQCLPEYWGLSHDITGCRSCDCDFGGAYNNRCMMDNGQCPCRPHITSRLCDEVQLGYFCASLDFYTYEAEHALPYSPEDLQIPPDVEIAHREQGHGRVVTWTGPGFARVKDGAGLVFTIDNIPYSMDYDIIIRYETESTEDWEAIISITSHSLPMSLRCGNILSSEQTYIVKLLHDQRYIKMPRPFCFESNNRYMVAIRFQRFGVAERYFNAFILIDSLVLFPKYTELPGFHGNDPLAIHHREEMERYMCVESFMMVPMPELAEMCIKLLCSISAILHDGAVPCNCDPQGSYSAVCEKIGGQCQCKPNVIGHRCDQCAPGTYGFGPYGCSPCDCDPLGSSTPQCDRHTGKCICVEGATGQKCNQCDRGFTGHFPKCIRCHHCFQQWESIVNHLYEEIRRIEQRIKHIENTGVPSDTLDRRIQELQEKLVQIQNLLKDRSTEMIFQIVKQFENIKMYYYESLEAERRANESVFGDRSPVAESQETRIKTEDLLNRKKNEFHRTMTAHTKTLKELQNKTKDLDSNLNHLNEKVCGSMNKEKNGKHNCTTDPCGGAGCRDEFNKRKCGGETCNGAVSSAFKALKVVQNKSSEIEAIADRLSDVEKELRNIKMIAEEAKSQTQNTLKKAQTTKDEIDESNQKLKEFLKKIKDFLSEEGADPKNIDLVSRLVLNISLPVTSGNLSEIIRQIRESISSLGNVDQILNSTAKHLKQAQDLLNEANDAKSRAEDIKEVVNDTKLALETAQMSIDEANRTLKKAQKNIKGINKTTEMDFQEINQKFKELNKTIGGTEGMGDLSSRVNKVKEEAEELLRAANDKIKNVEVFAAAVAQDPDQAHGCSQGSCYPATGDLLVGRANKLKATSTCGLRRKEPYCIVSHLQDEKKCFQCDSRHPYDPVYNHISHRIENVITTFKEHRKKSWWQSENGKSEVSIQLDLEAEFHFTHLIMTFKTFRPAAMLIERSADFGRTWQVYRYFAYDCPSVFPGISQGPLRKVNDVFCESRYSDIEPSTEGEVSERLDWMGMPFSQVIYRVLDPAIPIKDPYSPAIQNLLKITNLRVNFTKLHTLGDNLLDSRVEIKEKYYYALYELVVRGNCFCYGHASECAPIAGIRDDIEGMVHGRCVCKHNTQGLNCEQCGDFHNDLPWRPAEGKNTNACKKCNCNSHASRCHFDMAVYLSTGNISGGVCDDCLHNTMGRSCEMCKPFYYKDPTKDMRDPGVCVACDCDPDGSLNGGICDGHDDPALRMIAGQCRCKEHVEGQRCDKCKSGYFGLSAENPKGCQPCQCDPRGTVSEGPQCDPISGDCFCKRLVTGRSCNKCLPEHWALSHDLHGCRSCDCDVGGAHDNLCSMENGQCQCRSHMVGRQCNQVESGYYFMALDHYTYEAEFAHLGQGCVVVERSSNRVPTWTGSGFVRVPERSKLEFKINNIPYSMEYDLLIRYEPQDYGCPVNAACHIPLELPTHPVPTDTELPPLFVQLQQPVCLERGVSYIIRLEFPRYTSRENVANANILIDSIVLLPRYSSLEMFIAGDPTSLSRKENYERYHCHDTAKAVVRPQPSDVCAKLISSMSATIHGGALRPRCDECAPGYYGNPSQPGGRCQACQCHNNIDITDQEACDRRTGECKKCLYNTEGPGCGVCRAGYFGDASRRDCRKCTCNFLGTDRSQCRSQEECTCERSSGQCQCMPNVVGRNCDHCAVNFWNLASGSGCIACGCDPNNAISPACNEFTGKCQCRQGFGGRTCQECQDNYWGDPNVQCRACDCDPRGIEISQCRRSTGHCVCRQGVSGVRCDQCARGFSGKFPDCQPCHQCFGDWDRVVQDLAARTRNLAERARQIQQTGLTGVYEKNFRELEEKLAQAQTIVNARNATAESITKLMDLMKGLRNKISELTDTLNRLEGQLTTVQDNNFATSNNLSSLEREARKVNMSASELERQLDVLKNSNFLGAYDSIRGSYNKSRAAERLANESTITTPSTVSQSADTRRKTERLMAEKKDDFNKKNAANKRALNDLNGRVQMLDLKKINEKVCGATEDVPCAESPCGGAGCRNDEGNRHCGGLNCNGAVAMADNALERAKHAEKELTNAIREVEELFQKVAEAKLKAEDAKVRAQAALDKANATKARVEKSNNELRDLINQIRNFLTQEGADPDSIEMVASRVLQLSIPASPEQIQHLAEEIKDRVNSLSNVDSILEQTNDDVRKAEQLLQDAKRARTRAESVKNTAEMVKQALEDARKAQTAAERAIQRAKNDIDQTEDKLTQMRSATDINEKNLKDAMDRLGLIGRQIDDLKTKRANNSLMASRAEETATMARDKANEAKTILDGELTDKYKTVQDLVDRKAKTVQEAKRKAEKLRDEAKQLLKEAHNKLQRLNDLEKDYMANEKILERKASQLDGLEEKMRGILGAINQQIQIYNTCQ
ncbi:LAMB1 protein, partial [Polypterus senegalus]